MRVEHYDEETQEIHVLLEDALPVDDPEQRYAYWRDRCDLLNEMIGRMRPSKLRQATILERDRARVQRNRYRHACGL